MIWELRASGTSATLHDHLLTAWQDAITANPGAPTEEGGPATESPYRTGLAQEQIQVAVGTASSLASRGPEGLEYDVLLRGNDEPGSYGWRISLGQAVPPAADAEAPAA